MAPPSRFLRAVTVAAVTGVVSVSAAWAGAGLGPVRDAADQDVDGFDVTSRTGSDLTSATETPGDELDGEVDLEDLLEGIDGDRRVLAGAHAVSIVPDPAAYDGTWERDYADCAVLNPSGEGLQELIGDPSSGAHLAHAGTPWPENPDCLYMGGYGIGPMFPITDVHPELGLWVRTTALLDDEGDAVVLTVIDAEGYFWDYANKCDDCGVKQLSAELGDTLGLAPESFVIAATHSHTSPDLIGGWGFVPDWYMEQVGDAIRESVTTAVETARPAVLEVGEERAREFNRERRDTYRSAEEQQMTWFRALAVEDEDDGEAGEVIATVAAYAGHPVTAEHEEGLAHPDWPGALALALEDRFGGVGMHLMTGLGNLSPSRPAHLDHESTDTATEIGLGLAELVPAIGSGYLLPDTDIQAARSVWRQPATNVPLTSLAVPGFFDHTFAPIPATVRTGPEPETAPCVSASPYSVEVPASAFRIGPDLAITTGPGELFSNLTNTIKEKSGALVTMPLAQANDALGYIPQSFELNPVAQQGLGFAVGGYVFVNYEDSYAIDRCFGDMVLETTLGMLNGLPRG